MCPSNGCINEFILGRKSKSATVGHCIASIDADVEQRLIQLIRIREHPRQHRAQVEGDLNGLGKSLLDQSADGGDDAVDICARKDDLGFARQSEQLAKARNAAMASKDFSAVDALKSALIAAGVEVRMSKASVELVPGPDFDPAKLEALQ